MKRIVTIQDVSCFGKCSITVALPLVSAMGIECAIIPTSVLSTHTGGFEGFTFRDLSDDIPKISEHWQKYNIEFEIDPGTQVDLYVYGEGKLTNGVAANYIFWIRERRGGFEYFVVTTQYQRLEKKRI